MTPPTHTGRTRRELVAATLARKLTAGDRRELQKLIGLERIAVQLYERAALTTLNGASARELARALHEEESVHLDGLVSLVGTAPQARGAGAGDLATLQSDLARHGFGTDLRALHSESGWLTVLEDLESALQGAYYEAMGALQDRDVALLAARILASEAQHRTLLSRLRAPRDLGSQVPTAIVSGNVRPLSQ